MQFKRLKTSETVSYKVRETAHVTNPPRKHSRFSYFFCPPPLCVAAEKRPFSYIPWQNLISQVLLYLKSPTLPTSAYPHTIAILNSVLQSSKSLSKSFYLFEAFWLKWTVNPFLWAPQNTASHRLWRPAFERHAEMKLGWVFCRYAIFHPIPHMVC